jgi:hypothetical protein
MKRITRWIIGAPSLLVILVAFLCIISSWGARTFLTKGINVGMEGIVIVIRTGEATLGRLENIVSETLPTAITAVESMLATDRAPSQNIPVIQVWKKIEAIRTKITGWITWLLMGIFLVMFWVAGGQIYLLWHFVLFY